MLCKILGAPSQDGSRRLGCEMGPSALRVAGLADALHELGHTVIDLGTVTPAPKRQFSHPNPALYALSEVVAWTEALNEAAYHASAEGLPIFMGGDHTIAAGTIPGLARRAAENGRPLFVLWLDAHTDFHTLDSTVSGNLHGVPLAYILGQAGFDGYFPPLHTAIEPKNLCVMGIRSVDVAERRAIAATGAQVVDMRSIDETGIMKPLSIFLDKVKDAGGLLHVSFDVDFLEPAIAPAVGTTVPGGATFREAHLVMEILSDSGLVTSMDLTELNPFLDERGRTACLLVDLAASLLGRRIMDRANGTY